MAKQVIQLHCSGCNTQSEITVAKFRDFIKVKGIILFDEVLPGDQFTASCCGKCKYGQTPTLSQRLTGE